MKVFFFCDEINSAVADAASAAAEQLFICIKREIGTVL